MNRQIKFRAKPKEGGDWFSGSHVYLPDSESHHIIPCGTYRPHWDDIKIDQVEVDPDTLGQFTGLTDANGTEIYEGDIFKDSYYDWDDEKEIEYYITVKWDEPSCGFIVSQSDYHDEVEMHHLAYNEIIGNVHDNPDLLATTN